MATLPLSSKADGVVEPSVPVLFLPGYQNTPEVAWMREATSVLAGHGREANMVRIPPEEFPDRRYCLNAIHDAVMSFPDQIDLAGFSMGGGALEMYLHDFEPLNEEGNNKIRRAIIISGRNLFRYNSVDAPVGLRPFYKQLTDPNRVASKVEEIRVAYGFREPRGFREGGEELAALFNVKPFVYDVEHGGIVGDPQILLEVLQ